MRETEAERGLFESVWWSLAALRLPFKPEPSDSKTCALPVESAPRKDSVVLIVWS